MVHQSKRQAKVENRTRKMNSEEKTWRENIKGEVMGKDLQDCVSSVGQTKWTLRRT